MSRKLETVADRAPGLAEECLNGLSLLQQRPFVVEGLADKLGEMARVEGVNDWSFRSRILRVIGKLEANYPSEITDNLRPEDERVITRLLRARAMLQVQLAAASRNRSLSTAVERAAQDLMRPTETTQLPPPYRLPSWTMTAIRRRPPGRIGTERSLG